MRAGELFWPSEFYCTDVKIDWSLAQLLLLWSVA
jgi:hypothetical protein